MSMTILASAMLLRFFVKGRNRHVVLSSNLEMKILCENLFQLELLSMQTNLF